MRRILLVILAALLGSSTLLALYLAIDVDLDNVSPQVAAPSYDALFEASVRQRTGSTYDQLTNARKLKTIGDILASRESDPVREVGLFRLRALPDRPAAFALLKRHMMSLGPDQFEVAAGSAAALGYPPATRFLDSLYAAIDADPAAHTPMGGYRRSRLLVSEAADGLAMTFREESRTAPEYGAADASEMALLFPADADYLVLVPNADDVLDRFHSSRFMKQLEGSPVPEDAWSLPLLRTLRTLRKRINESMGLVGRFFTPEELLRDHLAVARYGENFLLATFKDKNVGVAEAVISAFEALGSDFGIRHWKIGDASLSAISSRRSGRSMAFATLGSYLIVATDTALLSRSVRTFQTDRARSLAIEPLFNRSLRDLDQSGQRDVLFAWFNPSQALDITGSDRPAARRLAVLANVLGRTLTPLEQTDAGASLLSSMPGTIATDVAVGDSTSEVWRYVLDVRSVGRSAASASRSAPRASAGPRNARTRAPAAPATGSANAIDSLARLAGVDIARAVTPYVGRTWTFAYSGVEHLKRDYGYSSTAFDLSAIVSLRNPPQGFDTTLRRMFAGVTSLEYVRDTNTESDVMMWIAKDTVTNDTLLLERKFQPSFATIDGRFLVLGSTPAMLKATVQHIGAALLSATVPPGYQAASIRLDSFATNAARYLHAYLLRRDRYSPQEIADRIDPLRNALAVYSTAGWEFQERNGLRSGTGWFGGARK